MQPTTRRRLIQASVAAGAAATVTVALAAAPASAAVLESWSRSTTGAAASGTAEVANGYIINRFGVSDTKADGDCAYVETQFQTHERWIGLWLDYQGPVRKTNCGNGTTLYTSVQKSIEALTVVGVDAIRVKTKVCRNVPNASDNCSSWYVSPMYAVSP